MLGYFGYFGAWWPLILGYLFLSFRLLLQSPMYRLESNSGLLSIHPGLPIPNLSSEDSDSASAGMLGRRSIEGNLLAAKLQLTAIDESCVGPVAQMPIAELLELSLLFPGSEDCMGHVLELR